MRAHPHVSTKSVIFCIRRYVVIPRQSSLTPLTGSANIISSKLRWRLKHAADLLEALACDGPPIETMQEPGSAYSGTDHVDMALGQIGVSGSAWRVDVDAQVKLQEAANREAAKIRKLLAELDAGSEEDPRPVADEAAAAVSDAMLTC
jgi:hypothetical protein